jgi:beta propeller repeat protein
LQLFDPQTNIEQDLQCIPLTEKTGHDPRSITIGSTGIAMMASLKGSSQVDTFFHRFSDKSFTNLSNKYGTVFDQNMSGPLVVWAELIKPVLQVVLYDTVKNTKKVLDPTGKSQFLPRIEGDKVVWTDHRNAPGTYWNHGDSDIYLHDLKTGKTTVVIKHPARQSEPDVWGDWVVWEDWRNNPNPTPKYGSEFKESDIFAKNLKTGKEVQLTSLKGMEVKPRIEDGRVFFRAISWATQDTAYFMIDLKARGY